LEQELEEKDLRLLVVASLPEAPEHPDRARTGSNCSTQKFMDLDNIDEMIQYLEPEVLKQFSFAFWQKANDLNSRAATIGKLLSEQGSFFRTLIKPLPQGSEQLTSSGVLLTQWKRAYSDEVIAELKLQRDKLQTEYDNLQKQLNSCRKQIKDTLRAYNLAEDRRYQQELSEYRVAAERHTLEMEQIRSAAETLRQEAQQELATLRVRVE